MRFLAALLLLVALPALGQTGQAVLSCTAPTQNTDGTAISGAISYTFYRGTTATSQTTASPVQTACAYTFTGLAVGTHYFSAAATVNGVQSARSNVVSKTIVQVTPNPPSGLTVAQDTTAFVIVKSRDRVAMVPVGNVAPGTECDSTQQVLGRFVVPRASVTFAASVTDEVVFAACG